MCIYIYEHILMYGELWCFRFISNGSATAGRSWSSFWTPVRVSPAKPGASWDDQGWMFWDVLRLGKQAGFLMDLRDSACFETFMLMIYWWYHWAKLSTARSDQERRRRLLYECVRVNPHGAMADHIWPTIWPMQPKGKIPLGRGKLTKGIANKKSLLWPALTK